MLCFFYDKSLFEHVDFNRIFENENQSTISLSSSSSSTGQYQQNSTDTSIIGDKSLNVMQSESNHCNTTTINVDNSFSNVEVYNDDNQQMSFSDAHDHSQQQIYLPTISNLNSSISPDFHTSSSSSSFQQLNFSQLQHQQHLTIENSTRNYQNLKDLTLIILLIIVIFYKLRHLLPEINSRVANNWNCLLNFEQNLHQSFLHENFISILQKEYQKQRQNNRKRLELIDQEIKVLEKISKSLLNKELEISINRSMNNRTDLNEIKILSLNNTTNRPRSISPNQQQFNLPEHQSPSPSPPPQQPHQPSIESVKSTLTNSPVIIMPNEIIINKNFLLKTVDPLKGSTNLYRYCHVCGKQFKTKYKLNRHLYVHKDPSEKPFLCNWENCSYRSISRNDLNRHRMIHTGEKPYVCDVEGCDKRYSRSDKLRHHKLTAHLKDSIGKKEHLCIWPGCNFRCLNKPELNRHQLTHEAIKCDFVGCEKIFDKMEKLRKHREQDHLQAQSSSDLVTVREISFSQLPISITSTPDVINLERLPSGNTHQTQHLTPIPDSDHSNLIGDSNGHIQSPYANNQQLGLDKSLTTTIAISSDKHIIDQSQQQHQNVSVWSS